MASATSGGITIYRNARGRLQIFWQENVCAYGWMVQTWLVSLATD